ncbi:MAG TPA: restriction endonuclease subunit S [Pirellulaceae bacterium]|nr:restriction endonuclease subunit S [Pirellulaceae bacterium]
MSESNGPWPNVPLDALASEMCLGKMLDKNKNRGTLQPYLRNVNVRWLSFDLSNMKEMRFEPGEESRFGLNPGDLVICEGGEPGRAAVWKGQADNARIQKALHRVRFRADEYDPKFAAYFLYFGTTTNRFAKHYTGTTIKHLTGKALRQVEFPVPPLAEQRRIVAKIEELFSDLEAGVAALTRTRANLKRYRASVLKAAVEGALTAEWRIQHPQVEPASKLLERILIERRRQWEADQLAKFSAAGKQPPNNWQAKYVEPSPPDTTNRSILPVGWCWASVEQVGDVQLGRQRSPKNRSEKFPTKYIRAANLTEAGLALDDILDMEFQPSELKTYRLHRGDILLSEASGSPDQVGKPVVWNGEIEDCCFQNTVIRLKPTLAQSAYLLVVFRHFYVNKVFTKVAAGVGINHLSAAKFSRIVVPLAPLSEQTEIVATVSEKLSQIESAEVAIEHSLRRAARLRQSILKQAFEGKLVPQDPTDEPASAILDRIRFEQRDATDTGIPQASRKRRRQGEVS